MSKCNQDDCHEEVKNEQDCPCDSFHKGSMDIIIEEQLEDGSPNQNKNTRYVKICGSIEDCRVYPIIIDDTTGIGTLHLEDIASVKNVVVLVDENGQQMVNGDASTISYYVNGNRMEEDYVTITMSSSGREHHEVHIVNQQKGTTCLEVYKVLRDEFGDALDFYDDMQFILHLSGMGVKETIVLNAQNDFRVTIHHLTPGRYTLIEEDVCAYCTFYRFDNGEETTCAEFELGSGAHELQIINERLSQNVLTIDKYIRDDRGELIKPQDHECFEVRIIGERYDQIYTLTCENDFCIELKNLEPGFYDVRETCNQYEVSYLVNHQQERDYAHVEVRKCEASSVMIINTRVCCDSCTSPLRICKYMRCCDGSLMKPDNDACFKVMLCGCGFYQTFNLNACNNFCVDIDNICCGEYEIREIDNECYKTCYIVNDGKERTSAFVCLHENETNCVSIINEERNKGSVSISKYIRNARGELVKPMKGDCFTVTLRSFFFCETFVLDEQNDWCMYFDHLREGSYEVRERSIGGYDTTYIVNGCKERKNARFIVDSECTNEIRIVNAPTKDDSGTLRIAKFIQLQNGKLVKPSADESFEVNVTGPCVDECFLLHSKNNWNVVLEGLEIGEYQIVESCSSGYEVTYIVNGCPQKTACVNLENESQEINIINSRQRGGNLEICAWIRDCEDNLVRPSRNASFDVFVEYRNETACYTLDARNRWCILLDDLQPGKYRIIQKDSYGYEVTYEIDHEERAHGLVELTGEDTCVRIINSISNCQGMVTIEKCMIDDCGECVRPCPGEEFAFILRAPGFKTHFTLNEENDFCVYYDDLREGTYYLEEENCGYEVSYRMNNEMMQDGKFILGREDVHIKVCNKELPQPALCVEKRIRENGRLCMPEPCDSFEFVITGKDFHEVFTLDVSNDFQVSLVGLCNQHYEIKELHVDGCVSYMINESLQADGYFRFHGEDMKVTIINEEGCDDRVRISKCIAEEHQQSKPYRWESFDIQIEGRNYKQRFTLDCDNDWCIDLCHLTPGNYEVKELGDYKNSFRINGQDCDNGCFFVGGGDVDIQVINHICCSGSLQISAYELEDGCRNMPYDGEYNFTLATCDWKETYTLNCENEWSLYFDELPAGDYTISSCDDHVSFEVDDEICKVAKFHVECETTTVALLVGPCAKKHGLTITKKMRDACGDISTPSNASYKIEVCNECGNQILCLNEENDYCVEVQLTAGLVEVKEHGNSDALYQLNCGPIHKHAKFDLQCDSTLTIFNPVEENNQICFQACVETCEGKQVRPNRNDCFEIKLEGKHFCETIILNRKNGWSNCFDDVPAGRYEISSNLEGYESVMFEKEGCRPSQSIKVENGSFDVQATFQMACNKGSLEILKYKKDSNCGCFVRPCQNECYEVKVWSENMEEVVTLNAENGWRARLSKLPAGKYYVEELCSEDDVTYIVNGGKECDYAIVMIDGDSSYVKVINAKHHKHMGSIEISKYIKEACMMQRPDPENTYSMVLKGPYEDQTFYLNDANDFCVIVKGLPEGTYEVVEEGTQNETTFVVNDGCEAKRGIVHVMQNHNKVQVLNQPITRGSILISKFVKGQDGKLQVPTSDESFRVHISKPNFNQVITLSKANNFKERLENLEDGWYVVDELDHDDVSYRINGGSEVDHGIVQVHGDEQDVWIINPTIAPKGSISITKYMRIGQRLMKPSANDVFQFHISKPGYNEIFTLNKDNQWTQILDDLDDGSYVIAEIDNAYEVSYIINGGSETNFGVVDVKGNDNTVFMINNASVESGSIQITKYLRNENGQLVRPSGDYVARVQVSRPGFNQFYDLTSANQWMETISGLADGQYVIEEIDPQGDVTYIINGGSEVSNAIVRVTQNQNIVQMINSKTDLSGSIQIIKYIRGTGEIPVRPTGDFKAQVHVSRPGYNKYFELNKENNWMVILLNLANGQYVIEEVNASGMVTYIINGGSEVSNGIVNVTQNQNVVQMINSPTAPSGSIQIIKYLRGSDGVPKRPTGDFQARVHVSKPGYNQTFDLNSANNWMVYITGLVNGQYVIDEIDPQGEVSYIINDGSEVSNAIVRVTQNQNIVQMINLLEQQTSLALRKYMKDENGNLIAPNAGSEFSIKVSSLDFSQTVVLNDMNNYQMMLTNITPGIYTIEELGGQYQTVYRVNNGEETPNAVIDVLDYTAAAVDIINSNKANPSTFEVYKYLLDTNGNFIKPNPNDIFRVQVFNANVNKVYTLNEGNRWHIVSNDLPQGNYELKEISDQGYRVQYLVNGTELSDTAFFQVAPGVNNIIEVVNDKKRMEDGNLKITKKIRNQNNELVMPGAEQSFDIRLYNRQGYDETFTLYEQNEFSVQLEKLVRGSYTIEEIGNVEYDVTYQMNGQSETSNATIMINGTPQQLTMINTRTAMFYHIDQSQNLKIVIE